MIPDVNSRTIVFTFGRMNPPTLGHSKLIEKVKSTADFHCADSLVFLSQSHDAQNNPLEFEYKCELFKKCFNDVYLSDNLEIKTPFQAFDWLSEYYDKLILVVGRDQLLNLGDRMAEYAIRKGKFFIAVSAGDRNSGEVSATQMREFVLKDEKELFMNNLPKTLSKEDLEFLYNKLLKTIVHCNISDK